MNGTATTFLIPPVPDENLMIDDIKVENEMVLTGQDQVDDDFFPNFDFNQDVNLFPESTTLKKEVVIHPWFPTAEM